MSKKDKKRILVFPCGSEVGLEIHQSMRYSTHFDLIGASSLDDHGRFVYEQYIGDVPMHNHPDFADALQNIIREQRIDAIYPTMDAVAETLHGLAAQLNVRVIGSSAETSAICASKSKTYQALKDHIPIPTPFHSLDDIEQYPIFLKPDKGYGGKGTVRANNRATAEHALSQNSTLIMQEFLPGAEFTIDCFSDRHGKLRFHGPRTRSRIKAGISVHTRPTNMFAEEFADWAEHINRILKPRGAWFFQAKVDQHGQPKLLEVAVRLAGSSALFRAKGVNFALLSAFDAFDQDVEILVNDFDIEMDRALTNRFKTDLDYTDVFVDLDDTLIVNGKVNHELVAFLYQNINDGKRISLITRHAGDLDATLSKFRLTQIFDRVIHITDGSPKADYIDVEKAVFIDDSFEERKAVGKKFFLTISPTFFHSAQDFFGKIDLNSKIKNLEKQKNHEEIINIYHNSSNKELDISIYIKALRLTNKLIEAKKYFEEKQSSDVRSLSEILIVYSRLSLWNNAKETARKLITLEPQKAIHYYKLSIAYCWLNKKTKEKFYKEKFIQLSEHLRIDEIIQSHLNFVHSTIKKKYTYQISYKGNNNLGCLRHTHNNSTYHTKISVNSVFSRLEVSFYQSISPNTTLVPAYYKSSTFKKINLITLEYLAPIDSTNITEEAITAHYLELLEEFGNIHLSKKYPIIPTITKRPISLSTYFASINKSTIVKKLQSSINDLTENNKSQLEKLFYLISTSNVLDNITPDHYSIINCDFHKDNILIKNCSLRTIDWTNTYKTVKLFGLAHCIHIDNLCIKKTLNKLYSIEWIDKIDIILFLFSYACMQILEDNTNIEKNILLEFIINEIQENMSYA